MARYLNGNGGTAGGYISIGNILQSVATSAVTFSIWCYPMAFAGTNGVNSLMGQSGNVSDCDLQIEDQSGTRLFRFYVTDTGGECIVVSTTVPAINTWYHVAASWSGTDASRMFVNGTQENSNTTNVSGTRLTNSNVFVIGHSGYWPQPTPARYFNGNLADAAIWNVVLSALEIAALAKGRRPSQVRPLSRVGYWPLDGLQSPEPDLSGNRNNGTLTGTSLAFGPPIGPSFYGPRASLIALGAAASLGQAIRRNEVMSRRRIIRPWEGR